MEDKTVYFKTEKKMITAVTRLEMETEISMEEYNALLAETDPAKMPIRKTRWCIPYAGHILEIDLYPFWKKQAVLECELSSENEEIIFPPELSILAEVTADPRYLNSSLALYKDLPSLEIV